MRVSLKASESIVENLLKESDVISYRIKNIYLTYLQTSNDILKKRLFIEYCDLKSRSEEIYLIAKDLKNYSKERISFSSLLLERCSRISKGLPNYI